MGWKETARLQSIPVLCPHMRQGGKECAPPVDTKLGSEREGVCPGSWTDSGGNRTATQDREPPRSTFLTLGPHYLRSSDQQHLSLLNAC